MSEMVRGKEAEVVERRFHVSSVYLYKSVILGGGDFKD